MPAAASRDTQADVSFNVSGAKDVAGNTQVAAPFFFNDTATTEIYTLSLHDALPISHLTDADATLTRTATITFSEAMDTSVAPTVSNDAGSTLTKTGRAHV